jgi:large subunit ribosomal protein L11
VPVFVEVFTDKTFKFVLKTPPVTELIKKRANAQKGSPRPQDQKVGKITRQDVKAIAAIKMPDLNAYNAEAAEKTIAGSARSMGVEVID